MSVKISDLQEKQNIQGNEYFVVDDSNGQEDSKKISSKLIMDPINSMKYYGDANIVPTDPNYFTYNDNGDGTCVIDGIAADFVATNPTEVVFPYEIDGLKVVGLDAHWDTNRYFNVELLSGITNTVESIMMPDTVESIGFQAFYSSMPNLANLRLSENLKTIGDCNFYGTTKIQELYVPDSIEEMEGNTHLCTYASIVNMPHHLFIHYSPGYATDNSTLIIRGGEEVSTSAPCISGKNVRVVLPETCKKIGKCLIFDSENPTLVIPSSVTEINIYTDYEDEYAYHYEYTSIFQDCTNPLIICEQGSYADTWAKENGINVKYNIVGNFYSREQADEKFQEKLTNEQLEHISSIENKVDKEEGKGLSEENYTTAEKDKLAGIATGANKTTIDSALSTTSTNPVQNKVVMAALNDRFTKDETIAEIDAALGGISSETLENMQNLMAELEAAGDIPSLIEGKADKATTLSGYSITDAYTKNETEELIAQGETQKSKSLSTVFDIYNDNQASEGFVKFAEIVHTGVSAENGCTLHIFQRYASDSYVKHIDAYVTVCASPSIDTSKSNYYYIHLEQLSGEDITDRLIYVKESDRVSFYMWRRNYQHIYATTDNIRGSQLNFFTDAFDTLTTEEELLAQGGVKATYVSQPLAQKAMADENGNNIANTYATKDELSNVGSTYELPAAGTSLGGVKSGGDVTISSGVITVKDDSHNHVISNVDGLQSALDSKANSSHAHSISDVTNLQNTLDGKASSTHTHNIDNISGLQNTLTTIQNSINGKSNTGHIHTEATQTTSGFMSAADKAKLDGLSENSSGENYANALTATITLLDALIDDKTIDYWNVSPVQHNFIVTLTNADGTEIDDYTGLSLRITSSNLSTIFSNATVSSATTYLKSATTGLFMIVKDNWGDVTSDYKATIQYNKDMNYISDVLMMTGTYNGDDKLSQTISLGKTPKAVFVACMGSFMIDYNYGAHHGGIAFVGTPALSMHATPVVEVVDGGFKVYNDDEKYINGDSAHANDGELCYSYIAWF